MPSLDTTLAALKDKFGAGIEQVVEFRGETTVIVRAELNTAVLGFLKTDQGFNFLADVTAYDDWPAEPRFHIVYQVRNLLGPVNLRVKCALAGETPVLASVTGVYPAANWQERELFDMFGVQITGHPDLRRILMPADWQGHPLRKDYPLGYEEVQFTFNFDEIEKKKPYAKE